MSADIGTLIVLVLAALAGAWAGVRSGHRLRRISLLGLNLLAAALLYQALRATPAALTQPVLRVLTAGAPVTDPAAAPGRLLIRLPGAAPDPNAQAWPDLGSALRQFPGVQTVEVLGQGLGADDLAALGKRQLRFSAETAITGLVELQAPSAAVVGETWQVRGRVAGPAVSRIRLLSPGGLPVGEQTLDADGRFALNASAPVAGQLEYRLELLAGTADAGAVLESTTLGLRVDPAPTLKLLVLSGGPDPELKYLRRWALDAGHQLASQISLSPGVPSSRTQMLELAGGSSVRAELTPEALAALDLVIVDERSWAGLRADAREHLLDAVRGGLGLLLRLRGRPESRVREDWARLGFEIRENQAPATVMFNRQLQLADGTESLPAPALSVNARVASRLRQDDSGQTLGLLRTEGRGRLAVWWLQDSFRLRLQGQAQAHGRLWSETLAAVSRARGQPELRWLKPAVAGSRATVCGLPMGADWQVESRAGSGPTLLTQPDLLMPGHSCAAWWPAQGGWFNLVQNGQRYPIHIAAADALPNQRAWQRQQDSLARAQTQPANTSSVAITALTQMHWWAAFVLVVSLLWWLERRVTVSRSS